MTSRLSTTTPMTPTTPSNLLHLPTPESFRDCDPLYLFLLIRSLPPRLHRSILTRLVLSPLTDPATYDPPGTNHAYEQPQPQQ